MISPLLERDGVGVCAINGLRGCDGESPETERKSLRDPDRESAAAGIGVARCAAKFVEELL